MLHGARNALDRPEVSPFRQIRLKIRVRFLKEIWHTDVRPRARPTAGPSATGPDRPADELHDPRRCVHTRLMFPGASAGPSASPTPEEGPVCLGAAVPRR